MIDDESLKNIEKLHQLKADGIITEEEFSKTKEELLGGERVAVPKQKPASDDPSKLADDDGYGWATLPIKRYTDFNGRSSRKEYWMFHLVFVAAAATWAVFTGIGTGAIANALLAIATLGLFIPHLAVQVRRFHDQDKSGWFALLNLIPYVGPLVAYIFMFLPGTAGDNRYGPDPKTD